MNNRRNLVIALAAGALAAPFASFAQQQGKVRRVGILVGTSDSYGHAQLAALRKGLDQLGERESTARPVERRELGGSNIRN